MYTNPLRADNPINRILWFRHFLPSSIKFSSKASEYSTDKNSVCTGLNNRKTTTPDKIQRVPPARIHFLKEVFQLKIKQRNRINSTRGGNFSQNMSGLNAYGPFANTKEAGGDCMRDEIFTEMAKRLAPLCIKVSPVRSP
mgnify:CR=1 FL=1